MLINYIGDIDADGELRTNNEYSSPYSFHEYALETRGDKSKIDQWVYSDRLLQWDYDLTRKLMKEYFGESGDFYDHREFDDIQDFLRDRLCASELELISIRKGCNISNGYPYYIFGFKRS